MRPFQTDAFDATIEAFLNNQSALCVMPTGVGKTVYFAHVVLARLALGRAMIVAHRKELLAQAANKIEAITKARPDVEIGAQYATEYQMYRRAKVVVSTVQTQVAGRDPHRRRMTRFDPKDFATLVIDEAHHAPAKIYRATIDHYTTNGELRVLGVTATPDRADEKALGTIFDTVAYEMGLLTAIKDGWLVPIRQRMIDVKSIDLTTVGTVAGDLNARELAAVMEEERNLWGVVNPTIEIAGDRQTLVFASSVEHAARMAEMINRVLPGKAALVTGKTKDDERETTMRRFASRDIQFLCNVDVATEGFDMPNVEVIAIARPTKSRARYAQMVGRSTRPLAPVDDYEEAADRRDLISRSEKPNALILDYVGDSGQHKLVTTADILGGDHDQDVIDLAVRTAKTHGEEVDMRQEIEEAIETRRREEEKRRDLRVGVRGRVKYSARLVDPFDIFDLAPERDKPYFAGRGATEKQVQFLEKARIPDPRGLTQQQAGQIQREVVRRWNSKQCTYRMANQLKRFGYPTTLSMEKAGAIIGAIAGNHWKALPHNHGLSREKMRDELDRERGVVRV